MRIGIISDTHDNLDAIDRAVKIFNRQKVDTVFHAGDVISPFAAERFKGLKSSISAVFGNNDGERTGLKSRFRELGTEISDFSEVELFKKRFAIYHGAFADVETELVLSQRYDAVVCGHTHEPKFKKNNRTLFINPGEACGYLTGRKTRI
jgi:putative phosphoesterase